MDVREAITTGWLPLADEFDPQWLVEMGYVTLIRPEHLSIDHNWSVAEKRHQMCPDCPAVNDLSRAVPDGWGVTVNIMRWGDSFVEVGDVIAKWET
jgi:hypothetical protein